MGFDRKLSRDDKFKKQKLAHTSARRKRLEVDQRVANAASVTVRNDLNPSLQVREVPVSELRASPHRSRKTTSDQLERTITAIATFGFSVPILIAHGEVIDGHIRLDAARKLGLDRVPAIEISHLSKLEIRALRLAVNRIGELGEYDFDQLRIEFETLIELDFDPTRTGFTSQEIDLVLTDEDGGSGDEDKQPPEWPVSQVGDVWELEDHRIVCGNALDAATYDALLDGEFAQAVLTDPPYNVPIAGNVSGLGKKKHGEFVMASGELDSDQWQRFLDTTLARLAAGVAPGSVLFVFMDWRSWHRLYPAGERAGLRLINTCVWNKESGGMGTLYRSQHELVAVLCKGDTPRTNNVELGRHGRNRSNVWTVPGANRRGSSANQMLAAHPTAKPVSLCADAILDVTERGDIVLDAFLGSGTTLVAAEQTGRRCRGIELDPRFVDVAIRRWEELTGEEAALKETGETFAEVAARRFGSVNDADQA